LQTALQFKFDRLTVNVIAGGCVMVVEYVAVQVLESVTVTVTTPGHNPELTETVGLAAAGLQT
jgi:hypothetical protein